MLSMKWLGACAVVVSPVALAGVTADPFADHVVAFDAGVDAAPGYNLLDAAIGSPERFSGENTAFPNVVSCFSPAFNADEIISIGLGGSLTVEFDEPVTDDPANPYGVDLLVFGNAFIFDLSWPEGIVGDLYAPVTPLIEVSADGVVWHPAPTVQPWGFAPTIGWLDAGPYATEPGMLPTNFTRPVNPALHVEDLFAAPYADVVGAYDGSGGGTGIDLADAGVSEVKYVRVTVAADAAGYVNIDAFSDVAPDSVFGDLDGDGTVNGADLGLMLAGWGPCVSCEADLNGDGVVDGADLGSLLAQWE